MLYIVYLDEFGHIGPFISKEHPKHNDSPVFGLGGMVLPAQDVRAFSEWFFDLKCNLLRFEIERDNISPYQWEKKGAALYTTRNVLKYPELRKATFRLINRIKDTGGMGFYVGLQKTHSPETHDAKRLYRAVLRESIKRIDQHCANRNAMFLMVLDEQRGDKDFRKQIIAESIRQMFGKHDVIGESLDGSRGGVTNPAFLDNPFLRVSLLRPPKPLPIPRTTLIEPPIQAESLYFQTLQCADWLCGLIGRVGCYKILPQQYPELAWTDTFFSSRLASISPTSGIRRENP